MNHLAFQIILLLVLLLPGTTFAGEEFSSPRAFAEHLREVLITRDRDAFVDMHIEYRYWSKDAARDPDYLKDIFEADADGRSISKFLKSPGLAISIYEYGPQTFQGSQCPSWDRLVIFYATVPVDTLLRLYQQESDQLFSMWKRDFVETHVFRCGNIYKFGGTAFHSHAHVPWVGDYG